ncbi:hypothetical protein KKH3_20680 [Pectobacterium actinidiae]|nr:hypothetical protein KKH3_20680 [Pectobacterium actinidiae]
MHHFCQRFHHIIWTLSAVREYTSRFPLFLLPKYLLVLSLL